MKTWHCRSHWSWLVAPPLALEIMGDRLLQSNIKLAVYALPAQSPTLPSRIERSRRSFPLLARIRGALHGGVAGQVDNPIMLIRLPAYVVSFTPCRAS